MVARYIPGLGPKEIVDAAALTAKGLPPPRKKTARKAETYRAARRNALKRKKAA